MRPAGIELDVAVAREQIAGGVDQCGLEATFPQCASAPVAYINNRVRFTYSRFNCRAIANALGGRGRSVQTWLQKRKRCQVQL